MFYFLLWIPRPYRNAPSYMITLIASALGRGGALVQFSVSKRRSRGRWEAFHKNLFCGFWGPSVTFFQRVSLDQAVALSRLGGPAPRTAEGFAAGARGPLCGGLRRALRRRPRPRAAPLPRLPSAAAPPPARLLFPRCRAVTRAFISWWLL